MYEIELTDSFFPPQSDDAVEEVTVGEVLRKIAAERGAAPALVELDMAGQTQRCWSYEELLGDAERLAFALASRFQPGERVAVWAPNIPEWVMMEYACGLAGLILVTANPAYQAKELRYVLEKSGAAALFLINSYRGNPMAEIAAEAIEGLPELRELVDLENPSQLYAKGDLPGELPKVSPGDAAQIQYTSGTTGFPKGAVLSHRGLLNNARYYAQRSSTDKDTVWVNMMPMFHTSGCGMITLGALQAGAKMMLMKIFDAEALARLIEQERITAILGVPTMYVALLEILEKSPHDVSSLRHASSGGSMVAPELVRNVKRALGCTFQTVYGQTETSPLITQQFATDTLEDICNTIGQPLPQTAVSIRDVAENTVMPLGGVGEICVKGYCNMIGYYNDEAATAQTIDAGGWLHTGDLGTMDARGFCRITGRVKEMIIRGGENLFPAEIENVLLEHPSVAEIAVVGLPDPKWGEIVACFIRPEPGVSLKRDTLHHHCREQLSPQKTPVIWCAVSEFPMTGSGKIQKFALRDKYLAGDYDHHLLEPA